MDSTHSRFEIRDSIVDKQKIALWHSVVFPYHLHVKVDKVAINVECLVGVIEHPRSVLRLCKRSASSRSAADPGQEPSIPKGPC